MSTIGRRLDKVERGLFPHNQTASIGQFIERGDEERRYSQLLGRAAAGVLTDAEDLEFDTIVFFALGRMREAGFRLADPAVVGTEEQRRAALLAAAAMATHEEALAEMELDELKK